MNYLLIDNSNTRTKFTIGSKERLADWQVRVPTSDICPSTLDETLSEQSWDAVLICSVVPEKAALMDNYFSNYPVHHLNHLSRMDIGINYPQPEQIGADRLANAQAAAHLYGSPAIVIDFGTAVTFDVIGPQGSYEGGVIAPGLAAMTDYLARRTALLPKIELLEPQSAIGKSTVDAMHIGAVYGYRGLVREIITKISSEITEPPCIVCTGGDSPLIAKELPEITTTAPNLTLEGLRLIAMLNFSGDHSPTLN